MGEEREPLPLQEREGWDSPDDLNVSQSSSLSRSDKFRKTFRRKSFNSQHLSCLLNTGSAVFTETREANFLDDDGLELESQTSSLYAYFEELLLSGLDQSLKVSKLTISSLFKLKNIKQNQQ